MVKYGLLIAKTNNLGDDIQSLAAKQFLPRVDYYIDRDNPKICCTDERVKVIMNGWFTHKPDTWMPSPQIEPLLISFHVSPDIAWRFLRKPIIEYLKNHEPIGTRDTWTEKLLNKYGIKSYFSGCLTLTLSYKYGPVKKKDKVLLIDISESIEKDIINIFSRKGFEIKSYTHFFVVPVITILKKIKMRLVFENSTDYFVNTTMKKKEVN
ncbi:hypothetical protein Pogu_2052 [Pyrobaculum oguniense TE7]|uniref:Polysaccharide pyruvyl transferase domain-containing protein n=1 Tax=Pyrobaculum oguniense (strain DSM 13380 / JCM 10595 / TE7) TaxID=698757 RepID=H6QB82_PYROT|nr:hypothetical protein Pogu_2052 [Pyrobaculum oguniense TE7]